MSENLALPPPVTRWVASGLKKQIVVGMAEMIVTNDPSAQLVTYALGSCVGVVIYDPFTKVGGMLHAMLPDSALNQGRPETRPFMYVDTGIPAMFHAAYALGGSKDRMLIKLAGGSELMDEKRVFRIGQRNIEATIALLARNGVRVNACETGGTRTRTLKLDISTGNLTIDVPGTKPYLL